MTDVIHLSKHAAAAPPNPDRLLETRVLLARGTDRDAAASEQRDCREMETNRKRA
ncbi:hypothetical protein [Shinella sp.]|uniref:hypothetical protein n=1 Tax=Shinella sp. TaxID=1870904 RepID=UPI00301B9157